MAGGQVQVQVPFAGEIATDHKLVAPGEASMAGEHGGSARPTTPRAAGETSEEKRFLALGDVAAAFLTGVAARGSGEPAP